MICVIWGVGGDHHSIVCTHDVTRIRNLVTHGTSSMLISDGSCGGCQRETPEQLHTLQHVLVRLRSAPFS